MSDTTPELSISSEHALRKRILEILQRTPLAFSLEDLASALHQEGVTNVQTHSLALLLCASEVSFSREREGDVYWHKCWDLCLSGVLAVTPTSVGFLTIPSDPVIESVFLKPNLARQFFHGDTLSCAVRPTRRPGKWTADSAVRTQIRGAFTGRIRRSGDNRFETIPLDTRIRHQFFLLNGAQFSPQNIYCIEPVMTENGDESTPFITLIGADHKRTTFVDAALLEHHWVSTQLPNLKPCDMYTSPSSESLYVDMTGLPFISVTNAIPSMYREHAVHVSSTGSGFSLSVAIADVTRLVKVGGEIDVAASHIAGALHLPFHVEKMLPDAISQQECALSAHAEQPQHALIAQIQIDADGQVRSSQFLLGKVQVSQDCTYSQIQAFCDGEDVSFTPDEQISLSAWIRLSEALLHRQEARKTPLPKVERLDAIISEEGVIKSFTIPTHSFANKMTECIMLEVNVAAGRLLAAHNLGVFKTQSSLSNSQLSPFRQALALAHPDLPVLDCETYEALVALTPLDKWPERLKLKLAKALPKATYSVEPSIFMSQGVDVFASITSPSRRYVDIVNHRCIKHAIGAERITKLVKKTDWLLETAQRGNSFERSMSGIGRAFWHMASTHYLKQLDGTSVTAVITSIKPSTIQVTLNQTSIVMDLSMHIYKPRPFYDSQRQVLVMDNQLELQVGDHVSCRIDFQRNSFFPLSLEL